MGKYIKSSVEDYLIKLSERKHVPGGGSAAALMAAVGAGLNLMVVNYSIDKDIEAESGHKLLTLRDKQNEILSRLKSMVDEDCEVFSSLMETISKGSDVQEKYKEAAVVPLNVCRKCYESIKITKILSAVGNKNLITDIGCAANTLNAAFDSAELNVEINLKFINDTMFISEAREEIKTLKSKILETKSFISSEVSKILGSK
jgi:methenyltetrahydrofolate cyclohydrolase